jgi:4-amino-4-deoxy-L-arabinose transferase-like glycosyltransferase
MLQCFNNRAGHYLVLVTAAAGLFFLNLGGPALWDVDEGRNATAALEMRESRNWTVPTFNGKLRSHKPALLYWLQATAYELWGINEFAARLPSALAAMVTVLVVYELGRRLFDPATGLTGGLVLASSVLFCASAHFANPDALLLTFSTVTLGLNWYGIVHHRNLALVAAGATAGLATLAKGPVGVVLPLAVTWAFLIWSGRWRMLFNRVWCWTSLVFLLVALPWYIQVALETRSEFLQEFLKTHYLERALSPMEDHSGPPWYYLAIIPIGMVPWSAFLGSAVWYSAWSLVRNPRHGMRARWARWQDGQLAEPGDVYQFLACWVGVYLLAFTLAATKLPNYILPTLPPLALVIARFLQRWRQGSLDLPRWLHPVSLAILVTVGTITGGGLLIASGALDVGLLRGRSWPGLEAWAPLGAVPIAGSLIAAWCLRRQARMAFVVVISITALGFLVPLAASGPGVLDSFRAPRPLVARAGALRRDLDIRVATYQLEFLPSLNFYVQRNVEHYDDWQKAVDFLKQELPAYLFLPRTDWEKWSTMGLLPYRVIGSHREMYRVGEVVVLTNQ